MSDQPIDRYQEHLKDKGRGGPVEECPVQCGTCCADGHYTCSKLGQNGCTLDREHRPAVCNAYLCPAAMEVKRLRELMDLSGLCLDACRDMLTGKMLPRTPIHIDAAKGLLEKRNVDHAIREIEG